MASVERLAGEYEKRYPETGVSEAQAAERMERIALKEDRASHKLTHRNRGIVVPDLPWMTTKEEGE